MMRKLLLVLFAFVFSASMIAQETVPFINAPSQAAAATVTYNMPVTGGFTLGTIDWDGFASTINAGTYASELTCIITGPGTLGSVTVSLGSGTTYAPGANFVGSTNFFDNAGDPAGTWVFDFYETYDDGDDGLPDANWDNIDFDFNAYAAPGGVTAPWTEVFGATLPAEWTNTSSTGEVWVFTTTGLGHSATSDHTTGTGYFAAVDDSESPHSIDVTLTTPMIDVSALTTPYLDFWMYSDDEGVAGNMTIHVNVWDGAAWNNDYATFSGNTVGWENKTVNLGSLTLTGTNIQIQFVGDETTSGTGWYDDVAIDDVTVAEAPIIPVISVTPNPHNYNYVQVGNTASQTFNVTNIGGGTGSITAASIAGDAEFTIFSTTGIPGSLPPDVIQVIVDFTPLAVGAYTATLTITDALGTTDVLLSGEGVAAIANDDCANAIVVGPTYPETVMGTTKGAVVDCPGVLDWGAVWYEVTLPYALNDLSASFCGTATPPMYTGGIVYLPDCASCASYVIADYYAFDACTAPDDNTLQMSWDAVVGPGTIMFPAYAADANDNGVDFTLTFDVIDATVILPGTDCANPIVVGSLGYMTSDNTANYGDTYSSADEICSSSSYLNGDDVVYSYTPAVDECIDITLINTGAWVGLFVYEGCAPFTTCVGVDTQSGGNPSLSGVSLTAGTTYYILISTWPTPQSTAYDLEIGLCPECPAPTAQTVSNTTSVGADFGWTHVDSFFDVFVEINPGTPPGPTTTPTLDDVANPVTWVGGAPNTTYDWWVRADCAAGGGTGQSEWTGPYTFTTLNPPPANDLCANAEVVTCGNTYPGTTADATFDDVGICGTSNTQAGVWFVFTGTGGMVSADLCGTVWDTKMSVFEGPCGSLVCLDGNDDFCDFQSRVDWYAESGIDYYILVHQYGATGGAFTLNVDCTDPVSAIWQDEDLNGDWFDADNWDVLDVPGTGTDVNIPAGLLDYPTIDRLAAAKNLDLEYGATILDNNFLTLIENASAQLTFSGNDLDWHLVSSPMMDAQAGVFMDMYLQSFDNSTYVYTDVEDELAPMEVMAGYGLYSTLGAANTVTFAGNPNFGSQSAGLATGADSYNWNLVGNPYMSGIDWDAVTIPGTMTTEVHYIEAATGNDLSYVQGVGGGGTQYVPPMQGFFVSGTGLLEIDDAVRTHDGGGMFYKDANPMLVVLEAAGENFADETWIHFSEIAGEEHDGQFDAYKRISLSNSELPQIYSTTPGGVMMSVNGMPEVQSVPVGFTAVESGVFTINAKETGDFTELYLEDLFTNTITSLLGNDYSFTYNAGDQQNRFILHFESLSLSDQEISDINIFSFDKKLYVEVPEFLSGTIMVYNIIGQEVAVEPITGVLNKITLEESGYFVVVVVTNDDKVVTDKVFIK